MRSSIISELLLYKYRYGVGLALFGICLISLLSQRLDLAPGGLTNADMATAASSANLKLTEILSSTVIDLPYHLVQKATINFLGLTDLAVVLPSIIFAVITGITFMLMVRRWFRMNVALITSLIFISSAAFLSIGRSGEPTIMTTFWLSLLLLAATNVIHPRGKTYAWLFVAVAILPISLYTPLMAYPLLATAIAALLHPHVRYALREVKPIAFFISTVYICLTLTPLVLSSIAHPSQISELLGLPASPITLASMFDNAVIVGQKLFNLWTVEIGSIPQPLFGVASLVIILLGFLKTVVDRHSARAYMLLIWTILMIPLVLINPDKLLICLIPAYLYMAIGVETLIREWYKLFPTNPYARLAGLIPLIILLGGIMYSNSTQYFGGHFFGKQTTAYSQALRKTNSLITEGIYKSNPVTIVTAPEQTAFYSLLTRKHSNVTVTSQSPEQLAQPTIIYDGVSVPGSYKAPSTIVTSHRTTASQVTLRIFTP